MNKALLTSKKQTWETPQDLFDKLNSVFNFNLDVCALKETAKCENYFTPEIDGLTQNWIGSCWMNPPYGRYQIDWIKKANDEVQKNNSTVVCLIPARPDTKVWQDVIFPNAAAITFIRGRLKFGGSKDSAPFPSALVIFGKIKEEQIKLLETLGKTFK